jgi:hypothetical protein
MRKRIILIHLASILNEFLKWKKIIGWKLKNIFNRLWNLLKQRIMKSLDVMDYVNIDMEIERNE